MVLGFRDITTYVHEHAMIDELDSALLQPASYDLTIQPVLYNTVYDSSESYNDSIVIDPGVLYLASTTASFNIPTNICARVDGKSTMGRNGLLVHVSAGFVDPGFCGELTLELYSLSRETLLIPKDTPLAQIVFQTVSWATNDEISAYNGNYQNQTGPTLPHTDYRAK